MQKYIIRRALKTIEAREIEAENWDDAVKQLEAFMDEPVPDECTMIYSLCSTEYIGDA